MPISHNLSMSTSVTTHVLLAPMQLVRLALRVQPVAQLVRLQLAHNAPIITSFSRTTATVIAKF